MEHDVRIKVEQSWIYFEERQTREAITWKEREKLKIWEKVEFDLIDGSKVKLCNLKSAQQKHKDKRKTTVTKTTEDVENYTKIKNGMWWLRC